MKRRERICFIGGNGFVGKDDEGGVKTAENVYGLENITGAALSWGKGPPPLGDRANRRGTVRRGWRR